MSEERKGIKPPHKIGLVGGYAISHAQARAEAIARKESPTIIIVGEPTDTPGSNIVEIHGKRYEEIEKDQNSLSKKAKQLMKYEPYLTYALDASIPGRKRIKELEQTIDLVQEFSLIQEKKSKLSRRDRDQIEHMFHRKYKEIQN